jgi:hypothetical protein
MLLKLLTFPISGPMWVARVVLDEAERQYYDEGAIHRQMAELEEAFDRGDINRDTFDRREEALLQRLLEARDYHRGQ